MDKDWGPTLLKRKVEKLWDLGAVHIRLDSYAWNVSTSHVYTSMGFIRYAHSWGLGAAHRPAEDVLGASGDLPMCQLQENTAIVAVLDHRWGERAFAASLLSELFWHDEAFIHFIGVRP